MTSILLHGAEQRQRKSLRAGTARSITERVIRGAGRLHACNKLGCSSNFMTSRLYLQTTPG
jgi:hypothetical protein